MTNTSEIDVSSVLEIITRLGALDHLDPDQDFYDAGVASITALPLLMELEGHFAVSIPDDRFINARSGRALCEMIAELKREPEA
jgi:acyl carrier protein